ncbi:serine hydrolase [Micromonospora krabiensis]|uniref:Beta-lactamase class A n=1 Tax=Micromonospora krabiensis TaxID=307121 RepID=A0A1C3N577_9ACTN|nr:serine hydrolase [Micromonospora krabiensis]SBV27739.1 Beta-lactamase class A [Micromonospora krabiensis]
MRVIAAGLALALLAPVPAVADGGDGGPDSGSDRPPASTLAWMAFPGGVFSVDSVARTVRYRACDGDTGRVDDPGMRVRGRVASGEVTVDGTTYAYGIPLVGRTRGLLEVTRPGEEPEGLVGEVVTEPQPPTDPAAGRRLLPLTGELSQVVDASTANPAGVAVRDLSGRYGDQQISVNSTFRPKAASVIKLWILVELLRRVDCGQVSLDDGVLVTPAQVVDGTGELQHETFPQVVTLYRLARYMIKYSDNTAANVLIDYFGGFAPVNDLIDSMNQRETILARKMLDTEAAMRGEENYTSPDDVVALLGAVWDAQILTPATRDLMIGFMAEQTLNTKIPAALPPGVPVAHKTGDLPDASHDVGYYLIPGAQVAVAFLTSGPIATGDETVRRLARTVYDYLVDVGPVEE